MDELREQLEELKCAKESLEIELASEDENFTKPEWLGAEVTGDRRYYNSMLSLNPYSHWYKA